VAARRVEQVEIEILRQVPPEAHALIVELHPFGREVVRADDGGIASRVAAADVSFLDHGDVANTMVAGQVVRGRQAVAAGADDHDVVGRFQRLVAREHPRFRVLARQAEAD